MSSSAPEGCPLCGVGPDDECSMDCPSRTVTVDGPLSIRGLLRHNEFGDTASTALISEEEYAATETIMREELGPDYKRDQAYRLLVLVSSMAHISGVDLQELDDDDPVAKFFVRLRIMSGVVGQELRKRLG